MIGKAKEQNKVYRHSLDRLYCFGWLSAGQYRHEDLKHRNPLEKDSSGITGTSDKIEPEHGLLWAGIRLAFLYSHKEVLSKEIDFWYHVHWVGEFIGAVGALANVNKVE